MAPIASDDKADKTLPCGCVAPEEKGFWNTSVALPGTPLKILLTQCNQCQRIVSSRVVEIRPKENLITVAN
jgi:hypothetical protein